MTRLFLRFYFGVVGILVLAGLIQSWLTGERFAAQNAKVVSDALFGGVRNARDKYRFGLERGFADRLLTNIKNQFDYPVKLIAVDPGLAFDVRLADGLEEGFGDGTFILARVKPTSPQTLLFGPLPRLPEPSVQEFLTGAGAVFAIAALLIALLLRPVAAQFQQVEEVATAIADGDLSARIEHPRDIQSTKLGRAFNDMASRTESLVRSQRELLQAVSHELRTPLARIHFAIDLIKEGDEASRQERLDSITSAADDLDELVGELLSYVRLEGEASKIVNALELGSIVQNVVAKYQPQCRKIQIEVGELLSRGDVVASVEPAAFERVVSNLVSNAIRFADSKIVISAEVADGLVVISVDDDGRGIPDDDRSRVLQPFVKSDGPAGGVGLGLSIVQRIVDRHNGTLTLAKSPFGGCRVQTTWLSSMNLLR